MLIRENNMKKMESFGKTDIGLRRPGNEDVFYIDPQGRFCLVADGMGGAAAGEVASFIFAESVREIFSKGSEKFQPETTELVRAAFQTANKNILDHVKQNHLHKGMGCTAELLSFNNNEIVLGHIGDSRTYHYRHGHLTQVTRDHSFVQEQIEQGLITAQEAKKHHLRNVILRAVGITKSIALDLVRITLRDNDLFMMCSDGLTDMVSDDQISKVLGLESNIEQKAQMLIDLAKAAGGYDNITVVLCRFNKMDKNS
jgi:PPM family protein phosphatase